MNPFWILTLATYVLGVQLGPSNQQKPIEQRPAISGPAVPIVPAIAVAAPDTAIAIIDTLTEEEEAKVARSMVGVDPQIALPVATYAVPAEAAKLQRYMDAASRGLYPIVKDALKRIDEMPQRLLAIKYYERKQGGLAGKWAWSARQFEQYKKMKEYRRAISEVEKVKSTFAELNPGYTLKVNTEARSVEQQIELWNGAGSVETASNSLYKKALEFTADTTLADVPDVVGVMRFRRFLAEHRVFRVPTVAVPGFSDHGRLRAFDFIVLKGDTIVAGASSGMAIGAWAGKEGWMVKLKEAITSASDKFEGPLSSPYEPWHYTYKGPEPTIRIKTPPARLKKTLDMRGPMAARFVP